MTAFLVAQGTKHSGKSRARDSVATNHPVTRCWYTLRSVARDCPSTTADVGLSLERGVDRDTAAAYVSCSNSPFRSAGADSSYIRGANAIPG